MAVAAQAQASPLSSPLILIVEDEVLARIALAAMLERASFRVVSVTSAEEALQVLKHLTKRAFVR